VVVGGGGVDYCYDDDDDNQRSVWKNYCKCYVQVIIKGEVLKNKLKN
jgi:hypothetical protein